MSPLKVRAVARQIQGMHALEAQACWPTSPQIRPSRSKTLKSAMANTENIADEWMQRIFRVASLSWNRR